MVDSPPPVCINDWRVSRVLMEESPADEVRDMHTLSERGHTWLKGDPSTELLKPDDWFLRSGPRMRRGPL